MLTYAIFRFSTRSETHHARLRRSVNHAFALSTLLDFEPLVNSCSSYWLKRTEELYVKGQDICPLSTWIQYFASGYALHGAYWHDVFGVPRSHGCINLAPIDARFVFMWTDPPVPEGWHGINIGSEMGEGTAVEIHE